MRTALVLQKSRDIGQSNLRALQNMYYFDPSSISAGSRVSPCLIPGLRQTSLNEISIPGIEMIKHGEAGAETGILSSVTPTTIIERGVPVTSVPVIVDIPAHAWACGFNEQWIAGQPMFCIDPILSDIEQDAIARLGAPIVTDDSDEFYMGSEESTVHQHVSKIVSVPQLMAVLREGSRFVEDLVVKFATGGIGHGSESSARGLVRLSNALRETRGRMPLLARDGPGSQTTERTGIQFRSVASASDDTVGDTIPPWVRSYFPQSSAGLRELGARNATSERQLQSAMSTNEPPVMDPNARASIPSSVGIPTERGGPESGAGHTRGVVASGDSAQQLLRILRRSHVSAREHHAAPQNVSQRPSQITSQSCCRDERTSQSLGAPQQLPSSSMRPTPRNQISPWEANGNATQTELHEDDGGDASEQPEFIGTKKVKAALGEKHKYAEAADGDSQDWEYFGITILTLPEYEWGAPHRWRRFASLQNGIAWYGNIVQIRRSIRFIGLYAGGTEEVPKIAVAGKVWCPHYWNRHTVVGSRVGFVVGRALSSESKKIPYIVRPWSSSGKRVPSSETLVFKDHSGNLCVGVYFQVGVVAAIDTRNIETRKPAVVDMFGIRPEAAELGAVYPDDYALLGRSRNWRGVRPDFAYDATTSSRAYVLLHVISGRD